MLHLSQKEIQNLITERLYNQKDTKRGINVRTYKIFVPGAWQTVITQQLWDRHRIACGFVFQRSRIHERHTAIVEGSTIFTLMFSIKKL